MSMPYLCFVEEVFHGPGLLTRKLTETRLGHVLEHSVDTELNEVTSAGHQQFKVSWANKI